MEKNNIDEELNLLNTAQRKFIYNYFKESFKVKNVRVSYSKQMKLQ